MYRFVLCTLLFWTLVPFLLPILILLHLYRACVILLQKIVDPDSNWIGIMSPRDMVTWEEMDKPRLHSALCSTLFLQGQVDLQKFQNDFMERVLSYRNPQGEFSYSKFEHYFENWMGFPFWKKEGRFDITQHIRFLTPGENGVMTEEQLFKITGDLMTRPFPAKKSPWEILIIPKYQPKNDENIKDSKNNTFVTIWRFHHTLFDGYSYHKMFLERMCGDEVITKQTESAPSRPVSRGIFGTLQKFMGILLNLGIYHAQFFFLDRDVNIWHKNGKGSKKLTGKIHTAKCKGVPFSATRNVSKKLGVAPTATMFSCVAGGIRRYFELKKLEIPEKMTTFFPWPVENHPMDGLVNHWSFVDIVFPMGEKDFVQRIKKTNVNFQELKNSPLPKLIWNLSPFFAALPTPIFNFLGWNRKSTMSATNYPGFNVFGDKSFVVFGKWKFLNRIDFLGRLRGNSAVQFVLLTENGEICVTISADRGILSEENTKELAQCINTEFAKLVHSF